jgi:uncharacterized cupin superfamily protein
MTELSRRSALSLAATTAFVATTAPFAAQAHLTAEGISGQLLGKCDSAIAGYKWIALRDVIYRPGAKTSNPQAMNDMICHVPAGELLVTQSNGAEFIVREGDVWACKAGVGEEIENICPTHAVVRIIDLISA